MGKYHVKAGHSRNLGQEKGEKSGTSRQNGTVGKYVCMYEVSQ